MSPLRMRIEDNTLAGLSPGTQATYIDAARKLAAYYRRSPDQPERGKAACLSSTCVSAERGAAPSRRAIYGPIPCLKKFAGSTRSTILHRAGFARGWGAAASCPHRRPLP